MALFPLHSALTKVRKRARKNKSCVPTAFELHGLILKQIFLHTATGKKTDLGQ